MYDLKTGKFFEKYEFFAGTEDIDYVKLVYEDEHIIKIMTSSFDHSETTLW